MKWHIETRKVSELKGYEHNPRALTKKGLADLKKSVDKFGLAEPIVINTDNVIIGGHARTKVLNPEQEVEVYVPDRTLSEEEYKELNIRLNKNIAGEWDFDILANAFEVPDLIEWGFTLDELSIGGHEDEGGEKNASLEDRFIVPPFSVLDARQGYWQDRKREWLSIGIRSEEGRGESLLGFESLADKFGDRGGVTKAKESASHKGGLTYGTTIGAYDGRKASENVAGTSIFDPVLCELAYRWFSPKEGVVLDPFAGGSVRGIVASRLKRRYVGSELSGKQVEANRKQAAEICTGSVPVWHEGDSAKVVPSLDVEADFVFSCPPYADLEVYSDDPADLSNMPYAKFLDMYRLIIAESCKKLKQDRFACFVVGEVRNAKDRQGAYLNFVGDTVQAFIDAGLSYYNEAILVTCVGSLPIRVGRQFTAGRKLGKTHQNVLVFVKGDAKKAADACGLIEITDVEGFSDYITDVD